MSLNRGNPINRNVNLFIRLTVLVQSYTVDLALEDVQVHCVHLRLKLSRDSSKLVFGELDGLIWSLELSCHSHPGLSIAGNMVLVNFLAACHFGDLIGYSILDWELAESCADLLVVLQRLKSLGNLPVIRLLSAWLLALLQAIHLGATIRLRHYHQPLQLERIVAVAILTGQLSNSVCSESGIIHVLLVGSGFLVGTILLLL